MTPATRLSGAHAILLASHLCASGNVSSLPQLQTRFPRHLSLERVLRLILTFLPESTDAQLYIPVLESLVDGTQFGAADADIDVSSVHSLPETVARKRVRKLRLLPLKQPNDDDDDDSTDLLTQFLIHRAHRIDSETSLQPLILDLLLPFYQRSSTVRTFLISSLLPLLRLNYEYYPSRDETISLDVLESMDNHTAINVLLSMTSPQRDPMDLLRNLRGLLGPWMYGDNRQKRRKLSGTQRNSIPLLEDEPHSQPSDPGWQYVNEWLLSRSLVDRESVVGAFADWDGPADVDLGVYTGGRTQVQGDESDLRVRYGQAGLAVVYASPESRKPTLSGSIQIISRVAELLNLDEYSFITDSATLPAVTFDTKPISSTSRASLLQNSLLLSSNPLTRPSASSISFLTAILLSLRTLSELGHVISCRAATNICLHSNEGMQRTDLQGVVTSIAKHARPGRDWGRVRQQVLWLRSWQRDNTADGQPYHGLFWRVSSEAAETEILKALLEAREYQLAVDIYTSWKPAPLEPAQVETAAKEAIFTAYDNASNGNRTRGGMKRAYEILQAFQPHFPTSVAFKQIHSLILATHALSFYSLTLQHGVPFQPVSIRVHPDPLSLLERVLDQNAKAYTKLDDLLSIGHNLVSAGLPTGLTDDNVLHAERDPSTSHDDSLIKAERRIMSLGISSALSSNDFGTAYSYILTRLTPPSLLPTASPFTNPTAIDDISWRAVYNAGRYRSASPSQSNLQSQITHLSQRMELLSLALVLVPYPEPLPEILGAWRRCDEEITGLRVRESEEEDAWDRKGDNTLSTVPGGFGPSDTEADAFETKQHLDKRARAQRSAARSQLEEAPMGLFDVARGAAAALQKNAFPLHSAAAGGGGASSQRPGVGPSHALAGDDDLPPESEEDGRVRKRDVVSNMVTGGLASGIGWVLGAQPVNR